MSPNCRLRCFEVECRCPLICAILSARVLGRGPRWRAVGSSTSSHGLLLIGCGGGSSLFPRAGLVYLGSRYARRCSAAGFVFGRRLLAGIIALIGVLDLREFRREIPVGRALFNRGQVALSVMAGSWIFMLARGDVGALTMGPSILPGLACDLAVDIAINYLLVSMYSVRIKSARPLLEVVADIRLGSARSFACMPTSASASLVSSLAAAFVALGDCWSPCVHRPGCHLLAKGASSSVTCLSGQIVVCRTRMKP